METINKLKFNVKNLRKTIDNHCQLYDVAGLNTQILKYITTDEKHKSGANYIIDYDNCFTVSKLTHNTLLFIAIFKKINIDISSMINMYSYFWRNKINNIDLEIVKANHISTAYEFVTCKKIQSKTILIKEDKDPLNLFVDINDIIIKPLEIKSIKLQHKYKFIFAFLTTELRNPLSGHYGADDYLTNFMDFIDNNCAANGSVLIQIELSLKTIAVLNYIFLDQHKFEKYEIINVDTTGLLDFSALDNCFIYFSGYSASKPSPSPPTLKDVPLVINNIMYDIIAYYNEKIISLHELYQNIMKHKNKQQIKKFVLESLNNKCISIGLYINPMYLIKFQYNRWKKIMSIYKNDHLNILELGVHMGTSSVWFLDNLMKHEDSKLYLVDTWEGSVEYGDSDFDKVFRKFKTNIRTAPNHHKTHILRCRTDEALLKFIDNKTMFNIIFIDASHDSRDVMFDAMLAWRVLKVDGILIFDDYLWAKMPNDYECPKIAIDSFAKLYKDNIQVLSAGYQFILKKIKEYSA